MFTYEVYMQVPFLKMDHNICLPQRIKRVLHVLYNFEPARAYLTLNCLEGSVNLLLVVGRDLMWDSSSNSKQFKVMYQTYVAHSRP